MSREATIDCRYCRGTGMVVDNGHRRKCSACGGTRVMHVDERDVQHGDTVRTVAERN